MLDSAALKGKILRAWRFIVGLFCAPEFQSNVTSPAEHGYASVVLLPIERNGSWGTCWVRGWVCDGVAIAEEWEEPLLPEDIREAERLMVWRLDA